MKYSEEEIFKTYEDLNRTSSPWGALIGALLAAVPATAIYAFFVQMGAILYIFLLIPPAIIGFAAKYTGKVFLIKHRAIVGVVAGLVHIGCVYYFDYKYAFYFVLAVIVAVAVITSKRQLNRIEDIVVDMQAEDRFNK